MVEGDLGKVTEFLKQRELLDFEFAALRIREHSNIYVRALQTCTGCDTITCPHFMEYGPRYALRDVLLPRPKQFPKCAFRWSGRQIRDHPSMLSSL